MNSEAKVIKNDNVRPGIEKLSAKEKRALSAAVTGYGMMAAAVEAMGISKDTIAKAKNGMAITSQTAEKIRLFLNTK